MDLRQKFRARRIGEPRFEAVRVESIQDTTNINSNFVQSQPR